MKRMLIAAAIVAGVAPAAAAQEPLTLSDAVARALAQNAAVRAVDAGVKEAGTRVDAARSGYMPHLRLAESWQRGDQPVFVFGSLLSQRRFTEANFAIDTLNHPDPVNNFKTMVAVQQVIFDGARTAAGVRAAKLGVSMATLEQRTLAAQLRLGATQAFGEALAAAAERDASASALAAAEEDLRRTTARRDAGFETDANVLALEVHAAEMRARQIRARSDAEIALVQLNQTMGEDLDRVFLLVPPPPPVAGAARDIAALEEAALAGRPELAQAAARRDLALANGDMARSMLLPQVGFQAAVEFNGHTFGDRASAWVVGTEVSWDLFSDGASRARRREAAYAAERASAERDRLESAVRVEVRSAVARLAAARAREAVGRAAVEQARESQRIIRDRYDAGMAAASDLLRANTAVLDAETLRTSTLVDLLVGTAALDRALGR